MFDEHQNTDHKILFSIYFCFYLVINHSVNIGFSGRWQALLDHCSKDLIHSKNIIKYLVTRRLMFYTTTYYRAGIVRDIMNNEISLCLVKKN